jgi:hypothetical protein
LCGTSTVVVSSTASRAATAIRLTVIRGRTDQQCPAVLAAEHAGEAIEPLRRGDLVDDLAPGASRTHRAPISSADQTCPSASSAQPSGPNSSSYSVCSSVVSRGVGAVPPATLRRLGRPGANRVRFSDRIGRLALRRGRDCLTVRATDGAGNRSAARRARSSASSADPDPAPRRVAPEEGTRTSSLGLPRLRDGTAVA